MGGGGRGGKGKDSPFASIAVSASGTGHFEQLNVFSNEPIPY